MPINVNNSNMFTLYQNLNSGIMQYHQGFTLANINSAPIQVPDKLEIQDKNSLQSSATSKLFPQGIEKIPISQNYNVGNCQLLAVLDNLSQNKSGQKILQNLISVQPDGTYKVIFTKYSDKPIKINSEEIKDYISLGLFDKIMNKLFIMAGFIRDTKSPKGINIIEIAYAKLMKELYPEKFDNIPNNKIKEVYNSNNYHYSSARVLEDITGLKVDTTLADNNSTDKICGSFSDEEKKYSGLTERTSKYLDNLALVTDKCLIIAATKNQGSASLDSKKQIIKFHDYSVRKIDLKRKEITLANPYDTTIPVTLSYNEFFKYFNLINVVEIPATIEKNT